MGIIRKLIKKITLVNIFEKAKWTKIIGQMEYFICTNSKNVIHKFLTTNMMKCAHN